MYCTSWWQIQNGSFVITNSQEKQERSKCWADFEILTKIFPSEMIIGQILREMQRKKSTEDITIQGNWSRNLSSFNVISLKYASCFKRQYFYGVDLLTFHFSFKWLLLLAMFKFLLLFKSFRICILTRVAILTG